MSVSLDIVPLAPALDLHGSPEAGLTTAYSLSGHVLISLASSVAFFESRPRPARLLLSSLELIFEGKSEIISSSSGYAGARIISIVKELLPEGQAIELTNEGHEDSTSPATWQVIFNLAIPGWLPASAIFGEDDLSGVSYSLFARATYNHLDDDSGALALPWKPWKLLSLCTAALRMRNRTIYAKPTPIYVTRVSNKASSVANYTIRPNAPEGTPEPTPIPAAILSNIEVLASIPTQISTTASSVPVTLRIRSTNDADISARLRVVSFHIDLEQHEKYYTTRSKSYSAAFPIPRSAQQPPNRALLDPHPLETLYSLGLMCTVDATEGPLGSRSWSIVPPDQPLLFHLHEHAPDSEDADGCSASSDTGSLLEDLTSSTSQGLNLGNGSWHKISVAMPLLSAPTASTSVQTFFDDDDFASPGARYYGPDPECRAEKGLKANDSHHPRRILRPSYDSPFFKFRHEAQIVVTCSYRDSAEVVYQSPVKFALPLKFVYTGPDELACTASSTSTETPLNGSLHLAASTPMPPTSLGSYPRTHPLGMNALPAYSQLYHANGDWRDEVYSDLPAYSKNAEDQPLLDTNEDMAVGLAH